MKIIKENITLVVSVCIGIILLILQKPITDSLVIKSERIDAKFSKYYTIKNTYLLPEELNEISGVTWLRNNVFATVQDESGIIYIYDTEQNKIIHQTKFADDGDYEAIAINRDDAYVLKSNGSIYEIKNFEKDSTEISEFKTLFNQENDMESLTFDKQNNRLLTIPKTEGLGKKHLKGIYQIPLTTKAIDSIAIMNIDLKAKALNSFRHKKIEKTFNPSDIAIHPKTKDIYILEGTKPKLLILSSSGKIKKVLELDSRRFAQPEGITFSADGRLFISNEATDENANIMEIQIK